MESQGIGQDPSRLDTNIPPCSSTPSQSSISLILWFRVTQVALLRSLQDAESQPEKAMRQKAPSGQTSKQADSHSKECLPGAGAAVWEAFGQEQPVSSLLAQAAGF